MRSLVEPLGLRNSSLHQMVGPSASRRTGTSGVGPICWRKRSAGSGRRLMHALLIEAPPEVFARANQRAMKELEQLLSRMFQAHPWHGVPAGSPEHRHRVHRDRPDRRGEVRARQAIRASAGSIGRSASPAAAPRSTGSSRRPTAARRSATRCAERTGDRTSTATATRSTSASSPRRPCPHGDILRRRGRSAGCA